MYTDFSRSWLDINLSATKNNFRNISRISTPCEVLAVLKADGYGLGATPIANALIDEGAKRIGVASAFEAAELRGVKAQLQVMSAVFPEEIPFLIESEIDLPVTDLTMAKEIASIAMQLGRIAKGHIKIDAGMGRLGIPIEHAYETILECAKLDGLELVGIFAHFPYSSEYNYEESHKQLRNFVLLIEKLKKNGISFAYCHIANSDAINHFPLAVKPPFNMVRAGITLHGLVDNGESAPPWLKSVPSFKSRLSAVRTLPKGRTVGYGGTYRLERDMRIGTIAAGYADGIPLALSNRGEVLLRGTRCKILGRISMDYTTIDLSNLPQAMPGDVVTLFGRDGNEEISVSDWAQIKGTHPYDIICSISPRVKRTYSGN